MFYRHANKTLRRIHEDPSFTGGLAPNLVRAFRRAVQFIASSLNETDFYQTKSLRFEKLTGNRKNERSIRLNGQYRLILEIEPGEDGHVIIIKEITDYH